VDQALHSPAVRKMVDDAFALAGSAFEMTAGPDHGGRCFLSYLGLRVMAKSGMPIEAMRRARNSALIGLSPDPTGTSAPATH
jgi:hypothetical protein